jgi:hypothetical protein
VVSLVWVSVLLRKERAFIVVDLQWRGPLLPPGVPNVIAVLREWTVEPGVGCGGEGIPSLEADTRDCRLGATPTNWGIPTSTCSGLLIR